MVKERFEFDFGVAQNVGVGRAAALVFAQKLGKHAVFVLGGEVDVFDLNANHVSHGGCVDEIDVGGAKFGVVIVLPVFHEDADDLIALLFEQVGGDRRVHAAAESHHHTFVVCHLPIIPLRDERRSGRCRPCPAENVGHFGGLRCSAAPRRCAVDVRWRAPRRRSSTRCERCRGPA